MLSQYLSTIPTYSTLQEQSLFVIYYYTSLCENWSYTRVLSGRWAEIIARFGISIHFPCDQILNLYIPTYTGLSCILYLNKSGMARFRSVVHVCIYLSPLLSHILLSFQEKLAFYSMSNIGNGLTSLSSCSSKLYHAWRIHTSR